MLIVLIIIYSVLFICLIWPVKHTKKKSNTNKKSQQNRIYTNRYLLDGFYDLRIYPLSITKHARQRIYERMSIYNKVQIKIRLYFLLIVEIQYLQYHSTWFRRG